MKLNWCKSRFAIMLFSLLRIGDLYSQACTSNPTTIGTSVNFGDITWTPSGGATVSDCNNMADGLITFVGDVIVDVANNRRITITTNINIDGSFLISGGSGSELRIDGGGANTLLYVTGDLGDASNNGVKYQVPGANDSIRVDGTIYGKNNNGFTGLGGVSGGTLNVKNGTTCGSPCPVEGNFDNCVDSDGFCSDNNALPIELGSFFAKSLKQTIEINWSTFSEINNDYFTIERSSDGLNYQPISTVSGAGNSSEELKYQYIDRNPLFGKSYYRLNQTDFDGASEIFAPVAVEFTSLANGGLKFDNPVRPGDKVTIYTNADDSELLSVSVYSMLGEEIIQQEFSGVNYSFDLSADVKPGIYFVKVASVSSEQTGRLVVR